MTINDGGAAMSRPIEEIEADLAAAKEAAGDAWDASGDKWDAAVNTACKRVDALRAELAAAQETLR